MPAAVSRNVSSGSGVAVSRSRRWKKNMAYGFLPSALRTWTVLRLLIPGSARRKRYLPGGSVTPGTAVGEAKVKTVRKSWGWAETIVCHATRHMAASSEPVITLRMEPPARSVIRRQSSNQDAGRVLGAVPDPDGGLE